MDEKIKEKKHNNSLRAIIILISVILIIGIVMGLVIRSKMNSKELFIYSCHIKGWSGYTDSGYIIYDNGVIEKFSKTKYTVNGKSKIDRIIQKNEISKDELEQLKQLANSIKEDLSENPDPDIKVNNAISLMNDKMEEKIYNTQSGNWVTLCEFNNYGTNTKYNNTDESKRILELTQQLFDKYF